MKVLIVCSSNSGKIAAFINDQVEALKSLEVQIEFFTINNKGIIGYIKHYFLLKNIIRIYNPDLIHAHYGLSGLLANLQRRIPVITTYHGSDINNKKVFYLSKISILFSSYNIFVSKKNAEKAKQKKNYDIIPCGVDVELFHPIDIVTARKQLKFDETDNIILFAGAFNNKVKNASLAKCATRALKNIKLIELSGYTRQQVSVVINASNVLLMTSFTEGSPQIVKEFMACNKPIVSVDVGDVKEVVSSLEGCFISSYNQQNIAEKLTLALEYSTTKFQTKGRQRIIELGLDNKKVAEKILYIYNEVYNQKIRSTFHQEQKLKKHSNQCS